MKYTLAKVTNRQAALSWARVPPVPSFTSNRQPQGFSNNRDANPSPRAHLLTVDLGDKLAALLHKDDLSAFCEGDAVKHLLELVHRRGLPGLHT
jgi:hypothetical protein